MRHGFGHRGGHGAHGVQIGMHFGRRGGFGGGFGRGWGGGPEFDESDGAPGRGRRRMFDGSELRLLLLALIAEQPRHGYDLIREIEERSGGAYAPSPGVVYPTITMLDEMGLIEEQKTEGAKKQFAATETGRAHLAEHAERVEAILARVAELGARRQKGEGAPVRRAIGNLKAVLANRLWRDDVDGDLVHQIAAIIDEAAQRIERL